MAVENLAGTGFRIASMFLGIIIAYMVSVIYRRTRGGSGGWTALTVTYVALGYWALLQIVYTMVSPDYGMRVVSGAILLGVIGLANPLTSILLARDMKLRKPSWFTMRNYSLSAAAFYAVMVAYNFFLSPYTNPFAEVISISLLSVGVLFLVAVYGYRILYKGTKLKFWYLMAISSLLVSAGVFLVVGFSGCCGLQGAIEGTGACSSWIYDYASVLPLPCPEGILPLLASGAIFILVGELVSLYAIFRIMKATG